MIKKLSYSLILSSLLATSLFSNNNDLQSEYQKYEQSQKMDYKTYKDTLEKEFKVYEDTMNEEYKEYKKSLSKYWDNPELPSKTSYVEYSKDKKVKKKIDYKNNYLEIDVLSKNEEEAKKRLALNLAKLVTENTQTSYKNDPVMQKVEKKVKQLKLVKTASVNKEPLVTKMIFKTVKPSMPVLKKYVYSHTAKPKVYKSKIPTLKRYSIRIKLPSRGFLAKAANFKSDVFKNAKRFNLPPEFIYAIIHTESSYNPMARSYVPAFGLMQIVPRSAGADAYNFLYKKKRILSPSYLYNSSKNILIGSAYLKRLYGGYMRRIKNPESRLYCSIAAYNTGAGNVACAFNSNKKRGGKTVCSRRAGDYNINNAAKIINRMTSNQVYNKLLKDLRYEEAQNYLRRVSKRMEMYHKVFKSGKM